ncbi:hypothetical protein PAXINDRAFT_104110 [Paxillus involutus ATCC 200175]|uniref:GST N-terminal domain-containing protein n=1 Tax=Paxillus involutus ATCC 200175 TaxID=664439 RepID=A0A0C9T8L4_PAXIN|nr:hypothetical protein PAXINDRAFT_104110 [Paxillus involutus ATCC 200175]
MASTEGDPIKFFDLDGQHRPYSPMTCFVLNYKQLSYRTEWIPFADVAKTMKQNHVLPTMETEPFYTVPAIIDNSNVQSGREPMIVCDSLAIARYLDETYPDHPIYIPLGRELVELHMQEIVALRRAFIHICVAHTSRLLEDRHKEAFITTRTKYFGVHPDDLFAPDRQEATWKAVYDGLGRLSDYIESLETYRPGAAFPFGGDAPCYADFALCAALIWFQKCSPEGAWEKIKDLNGEKWERLRKNCEPYSQVL